MQMKGIRHHITDVGYLPFVPEGGYIVCMVAPHHEPLDKASDAASDEQLMLAYGRGDAQAFEVLYARHKGTVYRLVLRSLSDRAVAEELYQDVWFSIVKARKHYKPEAKFMTWVGRIVSNRLIDHFRKSGQWDQYLTETDEDFEACAAGPAWRDPETMTHVNRQMARLLFCIDQLPPPQRQVFLMKEEAGLAVDEIAAVVSAGREAIKSRLRYAMQRLKACMGELL